MRLLTGTHTEVESTMVVGVSVSFPAAPFALASPDERFPAKHQWDALPFDHEQK